MTQNWREFKKHMLNKYPEMDAQEYSELLKSIKDNGFDNTMPITMYKGDDDSVPHIIDGWNRYRACVELDVIPVFKEFYGDTKDAATYILKTNIRRNLMAGQRAAVVLEMDEVVSMLVEQAAKRISPGRGGLIEDASVLDLGTTHKKLSEVAGVGQQTMKEAMQIKKHSLPLYAKMQAGEVSAKAAYQEVRDAINSSNVEVRKQMRAKALLKSAIQDAIDAAKDDLMAQAMEIIENEDNVKFTLKITRI